jgi:hypothetical protein
MGKSALSYLYLIIVAVGCATGHCRKSTPTPVTVEDKPEDGAVSSDAEAHVFVFKYDGSVLCGGKKAISLKKMKAELADITVLSSQKKNDGMMHIQVCGSATGVANVYEITAKDMAEADKRGFKKWNY